MSHAPTPTNDNYGPLNSLLSDRHRLLQVYHLSRRILHLCTIFVLMNSKVCWFSTELDQSVKNWILCYNICVREFFFWDAVWFHPDTQHYLEQQQVWYSRQLGEQKSSKSLMGEKMSLWKENECHAGIVFSSLSIEAMWLSQKASNDNGTWDKKNVDWVYLYYFYCLWNNIM